MCIYMYIGYAMDGFGYVKLVHKTIANNTLINKHTNSIPHSPNNNMKTSTVSSSHSVLSFDAAIPSTATNITNSVASTSINTMQWGDWNCMKCNQIICADRTACYYCKYIRK